MRLTSIARRLRLDDESARARVIDALAELFAAYLTEVTRGRPPRDLETRPRSRRGKRRGPRPQ